MPAPRKVADADVERVREWYRTRKTRRQWADELGCSVYTIDSFIHKPDYRPAPEPLSECGVTAAEFNRLVRSST